jgi:MFS family permease
MQILNSLKLKLFALLWSGQSISRLGDSLYRIALSWWVLEKTGSAVIMGTVLIVSFAPMLIFLLIGGIAVDRFSRTRLMLASDILRGIVVVLVAWLAYANTLEIWHIYVASILFGFVEAFFQPAYTALVPVIVPEESLPSANSLTNLSGQLAGMIGPAFGATLISLGGTSFAFLLDGISFFISAACLVPLVSGIQETHTKTETRNKVWHDFRDGFKTVFSIPWLWISIAVFALGNIFLSGPINIGLPFLVKNVLRQDVRVLGWLYSAASVGAFLGTVYMGRLVRIRHRGWLAYGSFLVTGLVILGIGLLHNLPALLAFMFINGVALSIFGMIWVNLLQDKIPNDKLGRVSSIDMLGSFALLPIGFGIVGWMTDLIGASHVFVIGGAVTILLAVLSLLSPHIRNLD